MPSSTFPHTYFPNVSLWPFKMNANHWAEGQLNVIPKFHTVSSTMGVSYMRISKGGWTAPFPSSATLLLAIQQVLGLSKAPHFQGLYFLMEQNHLGWKRPLRSSESNQIQIVVEDIEQNGPGEQQQWLGTSCIQTHSPPSAPDHDIFWKILVAQDLLLGKWEA